jgi:hypothetical protein
VYDHLPQPIKGKIYNWIQMNCANEKKPDQTDEQFIYKTRKKAFGPFKRQLYSLKPDIKDKISSAAEEEFSFLFEKLNIKGTKSLIDQHIKPVQVEKSKKDFI